MRDTIDMAREAGDDWDSTLSTDKEFLERLVALARADAIADEREQGQKWFDAVTAQHKQLILAEREACAKVCESRPLGTEYNNGNACAAAIRSRGNT
jgi:hypothetical protein